MIAAAVSVVSVKAADVPVRVMTPPTSAEATSVVPVPLATGVLTRDGKLWASAAMAREVDIDGVIVPPLADSRKTCSVPFRGAAIDDLHLREGRRLAAALGERKSPAAGGNRGALSGRRYARPPPSGSAKVAPARSTFCRHWECGASRRR